MPQQIECTEQEPILDVLATPRTELLLRVGWSTTTTTATYRSATHDGLVGLLLRLRLLGLLLLLLLLLLLGTGWDESTE